MDISPGSPDPRIRAIARERFEQTLAVVPLFQPLTLVCHTGYSERRYGHMKALWLAYSSAFWSRVCGRLRGTGAMLMLENVYEAQPEDLRPLLGSLDAGRAGFCLDTGHQSAFGRRDLGDWLDILGPYLGQIHLHDNLGERDEHLALGRGGIDFKKLFNGLARTGRPRPVITLEPPPRGGPGAEPGISRTVVAVAGRAGSIGRGEKAACVVRVLFVGIIRPLG